MAPKKGERPERQKVEQLPPDKKLKIPPALNEQMLEMLAQGKTLDDICVWLKATHGISVYNTAVSKRLRKLRGERSEIAKTVVREKLAKTIISDIDHLDREKRRLARLATMLYGRAISGTTTAGDIITKRSPTELYVHVVGELRKVVDVKLHYSGADTPDDTLSELAAAEGRLESRLARLAPKEPESDDPPGAGTDPAG